MKRYLLSIVTLLIVGWFAIPSGNCARSRVEAGTALKNVGRAAGMSWACFGEAGNFKDWYKGLSTEEKRGCRIILKSVRESGGKAPDVMRIMRDLARMDLVLAPPNTPYGLTLKQFCGKIDEFNTLAQELGGENVARSRKMIASMLSKAKDGGVGSVPRYNFIKGGVAEVMEILEMKKAGATITEIQPLLSGSRVLFRDAKCSGGPLTGNWWLEVKNYPFFDPGNAKHALKTQVTSHVQRLQLQGLIKDGTDIQNIDGIVYRFASAGSDMANFDLFKGTIISAFRATLIERCKERGRVTAEVLARIDQYVNTRVLVEPYS